MERTLTPIKRAKSKVCADVQKYKDYCIHEHYKQAISYGKLPSYISEQHTVHQYLTKKKKKSAGWLCVMNETVRWRVIWLYYHQHGKEVYIKTTQKWRLTARYSRGCTAVKNTASPDLQNEGEKKKPKIPLVKIRSALVSVDGRRGRSSLTFCD